MNYPHLAKLLKDKRGQEKMSQSQVSTNLDIDQRIYSKYERGINFPRKKEIQKKIAAWVGVKETELLFPSTKYKDIEEAIKYNSSLNNYFNTIMQETQLACYKKNGIDILFTNYLENNNYMLMEKHGTIYSKDSIITKIKFSKNKTNKIISLETFLDFQKDILEYIEFKYSKLKEVGEADVNKRNIKK